MFNTVSFIDVEDFCSMLDDVFTDEKAKRSKECTSVIATYDAAREIVAELLCYGYKLGCIDLDYEYFDEYEITVIEGNIFCCVLKRDGKYVYSNATTVYAMADVNSKCILESYPDAKNIAIVELEDEDEELSLYDEDDDIDCDACEYKDDCDVRFAKDEDGEVHSMTVSSSDGDRYVSHSIYCTDAFDQNEMLDFLADIFGL